MALDIKKFIARFIEEAKDHLGRLALGLAALEQDFDLENINGLFRSAHTLKGSSRMLKLAPITQIAHSLEDVLSALRDQRLTRSPAVSRLLYQGVDTLTDQVDALADGGQVAELTSQQLAFCKHLSAVAENPALLDEAPAAVIDNNAVDQVIDEPILDKPVPANKVVKPPSLKKASLKTSDTVRIKLNKLEDLIKLMGELVSNHSGMRELVTSARQLEQQVENNQPNLLAMQQFSYTMRETVQAQERLMQELHDKTLQMRMLPLGVVLDSASRLVRDMANSLNKQVECRIQGSEIELDRQMIDQLADPIIHLLRNALDHGIEMPEDRVKAGKSDTGTISISAEQSNGQMIITIENDSKGIENERITQKTLE